MGDRCVSPADPSPTPLPDLEDAADVAQVERVVALGGRGAQRGRERDVEVDGRHDDALAHRPHVRLHHLAARATKEPVHDGAKDAAQGDRVEGEEAEREEVAHVARRHGAAAAGK